VCARSLARVCFCVGIARHKTSGTLLFLTTFDWDFYHDCLRNILSQLLQLVLVVCLIGFNHTTKTVTISIKSITSQFTLALKSNKEYSITYTHCSNVQTDWLAAQHIINEPHITTSILDPTPDVTPSNAVFSHIYIAQAT
jgi:hypothetical protein